MSERRQIHFENEDDVVVELRRLRKGYRQHGNWTLAQIAWHLSSLIEKFLNPPASADARRTPEQDAMKQRFVDFIVANRRLPEHAKNAGPFTPPATAGDADIERFEAQLERLNAYPHPMVEMGPIGPVPIGECRIVHLVHAEHHLSFLEPTMPSRRIGLSYANEDALAEDVRKLRGGHVQTGNWTLPQICHHLEITMRSRMQPGPFPEDAPEQKAREQIKREVLRSGRLPGGIQAPAAILPPPDAGEAAIASFLKTVAQFKAYTGPIAPHRLFGTLPESDARRLNLIHCAHHLSYLVPAATPTKS